MDNDIEKATKKLKRDSTEKLTQLILTHATGPMLASGMSESAVVRMCEEVSAQYHERLFNRYKRDIAEVTAEVFK